MTANPQPHIAVASLCSPLEVGADRAAGAIEVIIARLLGQGCVCENLGKIDTPRDAVKAGCRASAARVDALLLIPASWFEDYLVIDLLEEYAGPLLFWSLPGMETGALCGTQQLTCFLRQLGQPYACVFGDTDDEDCLGRGMCFLRAARLHARLRRLRIGCGGQRVNGITHTAPNEFMLKKCIGPRIVTLDLPGIMEQAAAISEPEADAVWQRIKKRAGICRVPDTDGLDSIRFYLALCQQVQKHGLGALTIGCYPRLMGRVCLAASLLADSGVPLACEGDVHGALGMYILHTLTNESTHCTDWLDPVDANSVIFTHCGSGSFSLADDHATITLAPVRLMHRGVCTLFAAKPGPVTLLNLLPRADGYQLAMLSGTAVRTSMVFPGNPVQVRFARPVKELVNWIHEQGIAHHWMIGYTDVIDAIRAWSMIAGDGVVLLEP